MCQPIVQNETWKRHNDVTNVDKNLLFISARQKFKRCEDVMRAAPRTFGLGLLVFSLAFTLDIYAPN